MCKKNAGIYVMHMFVLYMLCEASIETILVVTDEKIYAKKISPKCGRHCVVLFSVALLSQAQCIPNQINPLMPNRYNCT